MDSALIDVQIDFINWQTVQVMETGLTDAFSV